MAVRCGTRPSAHRKNSYFSKIGRQISGLKRDPLTGRLKMRFNEEIRRLIEQPPSLAQSRFAGCRHVARGAFDPEDWQVLNRPPSLRPLSRPRLRWNTTCRWSGRQGFLAGGTPVSRTARRGVKIIRR